MTNLERVENMYSLIISLVCTKKLVTVKTRYFSVDFSIIDEVYHMRTGKVTAESESLYQLFALVKNIIERTSLCDDIEIFLDSKVFAVIKD